jgi:hypothetical protein
MNDRITSAQRSTILSLLREAEFDTDRVTLMYRRIGVVDRWQGEPVDAWLDSLWRAAASNVIARLQGIVS